MGIESGRGEQRRSKGSYKEAEEEEKGEDEAGTTNGDTVSD